MTRILYTSPASLGGSDGADGSDGASGLVAVSEELPGMQCANGGQRVESGADAGDIVRRLALGPLDCYDY